jgi:dihydroxy-acid dehydratase
MQPPAALIQKGIQWLPTLGDGRQSGTSDSPSILNCSPESAAGGACHGCTPATPSASTSTRVSATLWSMQPRSPAARPNPCPRAAQQHPWEELFREKTGQMGEGAVMDMAVKYRGLAAKTPRHNH